MKLLQLYKCLLINMKLLLIILNIFFANGMNPYQNYRSEIIEMEEPRMYPMERHRINMEMSELYEAINEILAREYSEYTSQGGTSARGFRDYIKKKKLARQHVPHCTYKRPTFFALFNYIYDQ